MKSLVALGGVLVSTALLPVPSTVDEFTTEVRLELRGDLVAVLPGGELLAVAEDGTEKTFPLQDGPLQLETAHQWEITCVAPQLWCPRVILDQVPDTAGLPQGGRSEKPVSVLHLPVYAGTWLSGHFSVDAGQESPGAGLAEGHLKLSTAQIGSRLAERVLVSGEHFRFKAPLGLLDFRLTFDGWAPVYRWQVPVVADSLKIIDDRESFDLGAIRLTRGSTVSGWVRDGRDSRPLPGAKLALLSPRSGSELAPAAPLFEAGCDAGGFFQIPAVPPGRYRLMASAPGKAPAVREDIEVVANSETLVGQIELSSPVTAMFQIDPPVHPDGVWRLLLKHTSPLPGEDTPEEREAGHDGFSEVTGLRPGRYLVQVLEPKATTTGIVTGFLYDADHDIEAGTFLAIDLPVLGVRGEVLLEGEPLAAEIHLETGSNDKIRLSSDAEGRFRGLMRRPHLGFFFATVFWRGQSGAEQSRQIEIFADLPEEGDLEFQINIPNRKIRGRVVDAKGASVPDANVEARFETWGISGSAKHPNVRSGSEGEFELAGLETGLYRLRAENNGQVSKIVDVSTDWSAGISGVLLVLGSSRSVEGRLQNAAGAPIPGAIVGFATSGREPAWIETTSDRLGRFEVRLPVGAGAAMLTVMAPTETLWTKCVTLPNAEEDQPWVLTPPPRPGGVLHFEYRSDLDLPPPRGIDHFLVNDAGGFLSGSNLARWASLNGRSQIRGPHQNLAPGHYSSYWHSGPWWTLVDMACGGAFSGSPGVALFDYGEATLKVDVKKHQDRTSSNL